MATLDNDYTDGIGTWLVDLRENERQNNDPEMLPPVENIHDVYNIHSGTVKVVSTLGDHVGWKCGACSEQAWKSFGLTEPFRAPLHRYRVFQQDSVPLSIPSVLQRGLLIIEAEFAFIMGSNLPPRKLPYTEKELWEAVRVVVPSLEIVGTRFGKKSLAQATGLQKVSDFGLNQCCVMGPAGIFGSACRKDLDNVTVDLLVNGRKVSTGSGAKVLGHPIRSLGWLAGNLNDSNISTRTHVYGGGAESGLLSGDVVFAGAATVLQAKEVKVGDVVTALFEGMGEVSFVMAEEGEKSSSSSRL